LESYKDQYKIVILGGSGQLGSELKTINNNNYFLIFPNRNDLDLRSQHEISNFFNNNEFDLIINLAAYTDVDKAEIEKEEALLLNHTAPRILAQETSKSNIGLIHISTDYVFGNKSLGPYYIDSQKDPINHYGLSKSLGEDDVLQFNNKSMVIRMASVFSIYGKKLC
jgi:dTDP-4-dehydrorhamnose reductase